MNKLTNKLLPLFVVLLFTITGGDKAYGDDKKPILITAFGDSLSSGYGLQANEGLAAVLEEVLRQRGLQVSVINAAIAGETSADALARVDWMLEEKPNIVVVEFGANDMLRGIPPALVHENLDKVLTRIKASGARVLLAGMFAPKNLGENYGRQFRLMYEKLRDKHKVAFYPFFLQDVALSPQLVLADGMHPNAEGVRLIAQNIAPLIEKLVRQ